MSNIQYWLGYGAPAWLPIFGGIALLVLLLWGIFWKGLALWHSAKRNEPYWFIALLVINTAGILEIIYLFGVAKLKWSELFK